LIDDLARRPVQGKVKDLGQIQRMYWIDNAAPSVGELAKALGLKPVPHHVIAFFPDELESKLLRLELSFRNRKEEDIQATRFRIVREAGGYQPKVEAQD